MQRSAPAVARVRAEVQPQLFPSGQVLKREAVALARRPAHAHARCCLPSPGAFDSWQLLNMGMCNGPDRQFATCVGPRQGKPVRSHASSKEAS